MATSWPARRRHTQVGTRWPMREIGMRSARSRRRKAARCRQPRPGPCAAEAGANALDLVRDCRPSACAVAAATGSFFSQRLGELRWPDIDEFALFDLVDEAWDRPVRTVCDGRFEQRYANPQRSLGLQRRRACIHARLSARRRRARIAAPKANCILANTEYLGDPRAGPAIERQQYGARRSASPRLRETAKTSARPLLATRLNRRSARHVPPPQIVRRRNHDQDPLVKFRESASTPRGKS